MSRPSKNLVLLACVAFGCGSPSELDGDYPPLEQTGYTDGNGGTTAGPGTGGTGGTNNVSGAGGTNNVSGAGGVASGGTGGTQGVAGTGGTQGVAGTAGTGGGAPTGQCPDDITTLFNRPSDQGGCAGGACHVPGATVPDLVSPGVETRLFNVISTNCNPRPYIGADQSLVADKLTGNQGACGFPMPFGEPAGTLNDADKACILDWIDEIAAGG